MTCALPAKHVGYHFMQFSQRYRCSAMESRATKMWVVRGNDWHVLEMGKTHDPIQFRNPALFLINSTCDRLFFALSPVPYNLARNIFRTRFTHLDLKLVHILSMLRQGLDQWGLIFSCERSKIYPSTEKVWPFFYCYREFQDF